MVPKADTPGPGQVSVWTYPNRPAVEPEPRRLRVQVAGRTIADTTAGLRVMERCHPLLFLFPSADVDGTVLSSSDTHRECEWKGVASLQTAVVGSRVIEAAALRFDRPSPAYRQISGMFAFFCGRMDTCWVGEMQAQPQPGGYFAGWITPDVAGPFKGGPGTWAW